MGGCSSKDNKDIDISKYEHLIRDDSNGLNFNGNNSEGDSLQTVSTAVQGLGKSVEPAPEISSYILNMGTPQSGELIEEENATPVIYYMQVDERWKDTIYGGEDTIGTSACGPTSMSIVVSSLTDILIDPVQMSAWAKANNYWYPESGSLHQVIPDTAEKFGISCTGVPNDRNTEEVISSALKEGKLVVVLMGKGHFTSGGHFIVLRGIDEDKKVYVADPASKERTMQTWDLSLIIEEARSWAAANGPFWIMSVE